MAGRWPTYVALATIVQLLTACSGGSTPDRAVSGEDARPAASARRAPAAPAAPAATGKLILAFGDSLYAGYGVAQNESFPHELQRALAARGVDAQVRNAGVSGETTLGGLQRIAFTLDGLPRKPDLVLLGLGGNDMLRGLAPTQSLENLRAILDVLRARQIPVLLTGMLAAPNMGADYAGRFNAIYPMLAKEYDVALYPFFLKDVIGRPEYMQADSLHPNPAGVDIVVGHIAPLVARTLESAAPGTAADKAPDGK